MRRLPRSLPRTLALFVGLSVFALFAFGGDTLPGRYLRTVTTIDAGRLGLRVRHIVISGAREDAAADIARVAGHWRGHDILGVDLSEAKREVETLGWVRTAVVRRLLPDTIAIAVEPRAPSAVWQHDGQVAVLDRDGVVIAEADPGRFPQLPLVVGAGADRHAAEILDALQGHRVAGLIVAVVRVDDRRWDLRLRDGGMVQLPAEEEASALNELDQLDLHTGLLRLGFDRIDLRTPGLLVVRPRTVDRS